MPRLNSVPYPPLAALLVWIVLLSVAPGTAWSFENFGTHKKSTATCQTACHKAENLIQARLDKAGLQECRECHAGPSGPINRSPFLPPGDFLKTSANADRSSSPSPRGSQDILAVRKSGSRQGSPAAKSKGKRETPPNMASVPAGEFIMGSNERWDDESPEYVERTKSFYIDLYEVTNEDYRKFVDAARREPPYHWPNGAIPKGREKHPVVYVNWFDANDYCKWAGKRLPTEEEWEKAARGEDGFVYPWGNEWVLDKSNNPYKHSTGTEPVGSYPAGRSPYGLHDMSGNVWEWVDSYYLPHPGNTTHRAEYGKDKRLLKGGSWFDCLSYGCGLSAPTFNRSFFTPEVRNNSFGFRCAKDAE
ncbi:MAG: formylglycine-generating enzyme family protein [Nitrospinae bacterium]|nr:formylglycine-generating enzyme family protein [Nitrospinota bacterium]